jgi:hypothetical protein
MCASFNLPGQTLLKGSLLPNKQSYSSSTAEHTLAAFVQNVELDTEIMSAVNSKNLPDITGTWILVRSLEYVNVKRICID